MLWCTIASDQPLGTIGEHRRTGRPDQGGDPPLRQTLAAGPPVSAHLRGRGRPHPDMIHHLMRVLKVEDATRVAKIGDTPSDLHEGTAAGCGFHATGC